MVENKSLTDSRSGHTGSRVRPSTLQVDPGASTLRTAVALSMHSASFEASLERVRTGKSTVELVHPPTAAGWSLPLSPSSLRIAVLDSSFNPPTLAHLALASAPPPDASGTYDARLLLLSVRNADKQLKPGDATYVQRMAMMALVAEQIENTHPSANVAVAIIDEPTFVGKSRILLAFLRQLMGSGQPSEAGSLPKVQLSFLQGFDTLERLLEPRYYGSSDRMHEALLAFFSPDGDNSRVVCARRRNQGRGFDAELEHERNVLESAADFIRSQNIVIMDLDHDLQSLSSTDARTKIRNGDSDWESIVPPCIAKYIVEQKLYSESE
ncbi:Nucleotidylyl transferase [Artomyces pyxidatus]|uniref:Nucleotidylyl transferase n=1 Tax=Artomyces pyxidatus TaxID=48021 RepID=A0ACB8TFS8_9AGAM|nr:Nucleotidylyl transferase [Artomyces pyxidatus]